MSNKSDFFKWLLTLLSVVLIWQLKIPTFFVNLAKFVGAKEDSLTYNFIVEFGIPFSLMIIIGLFSIFHDKCIWRYYKDSKFKGGWWIYTLQSLNNNQNPVKIVGYFRINQCSNSINIPEGKHFILRITVSLKEEHGQAILL